MANKKEYHAKWYQEHKTEIRELRRDIRKLAISILGGKCAVCGIEDYRVLQIDHINGGGNKENKRIGPDGIRKRVIAGEPGYQLLCANHNWIKKYENNEVQCQR